MEAGQEVRGGSEFRLKAWISRLSLTLKNVPTPEITPSTSLGKSKPVGERRPIARVIRTLGATPITSTA